MTSQNIRVITTKERMERNAIKLAAQKSAELSLLNFKVEEGQLRDEHPGKRKIQKKVSENRGSSRATSVPGLFSQAYYSNSYSSRYKRKEPNEVPKTLEENDVICGSNPKSRAHSGNINFQCLVKTFRSVYHPCYNVTHDNHVYSCYNVTLDKYCYSSKRGTQSTLHQGLKHRIIKYIFQDIRSRGGRFLKLMEEDSTLSWQELEDDFALEQIDRAMKIAATSFIELQRVQALRNFETFYSLQSGSTDISTVARTSAGVAGWANSNVTQPCSSPTNGFNSMACFDKNKVARKRSRWGPKPVNQRTEVEAKKVERIKDLKSERTRSVNEKVTEPTVAKQDHTLNVAIVQSEKDMEGNGSDNFLKDRHTEKRRTSHTDSDFELTCAHSNSGFQEGEESNNLQGGDPEKEMKKDLCPKEQETDDARIENVETNLDQEYYQTNSTDILIDGFIAVNLSEGKRQKHTNLQFDDDSLLEEWSLVESFGRVVISTKEKQN